MLEIHLFNFEEQIYDQDVEVEFLEYLRPEKKFSGIEELKTQIGQDVTKARAIYEAKLRASGYGIRAI